MYLHILNAPLTEFTRVFKLRLAEERLVKKREKRGEFLDADGIPIYDPNIKPDIIVNQAKSASSSDSRSKDIRIENFDISFAGNKILVVKKS